MEKEVKTGVNGVANQYFAKNRVFNFSLFHLYFYKAAGLAAFFV